MAAAHEQAPTSAYDFGPNGCCTLRPSLDKLLLFPCFHTPSIDCSNHNQPSLPSGLPCLCIQEHCSAQTLPLTPCPWITLQYVHTGKARCMPLFWLSLPILLTNICIIMRHIRISF